MAKVRLFMAGSENGLISLARKIFLFCCILFFSQTALLYFYSCLHITQNAYLAAQIDKIELLRNTPSPRLILIGGSNLPFSIDSIRLSQALGLPVVNMGLHGGLGLKYMLDSAKPLIRKDDFVIVAPEYENFVGEFDGSETLLNLFLVTRDINDLLTIKTADIFRAILDFKPVIPKAPYTRDSFNSSGDVIAHLSTANISFDPSTPLDPNLNYRSMDYLVDFMRECELKNINAGYIFPCLMMTNYKINSSIIAKMETALRQGISVIPGSTLMESIYADNLFFDNRYHTNSEGRRIRTKYLITILGDWIKTRSK